MKRLVAVVVLSVLGIMLASSPAPAETPTAVTIYTSLPFDKYDAEQTNDVVNGEQMALAEANNLAGSCQVTLKKLDDSTKRAGQWDPSATSINAREAAQDASTIAYIGEFNSGASAISIPILNQAGIVEVSPSNTALELTKSVGRADPGAPNKYYPTGQRTYARVAPTDHIQAGALAEWMKTRRVKRLFIADDKQVYGVSVARVVSLAARLNGIRVVGSTGIDQHAPNYRALARKIRHLRADGLFFGGITASNAARLYSDVVRASPKIELFGDEGVLDTTLTEGLSRGAQRRMHITSSTIEPVDYPGRQFFTDFQEKYGHDPAPYAIYGYEAMSLILDAMNRARGACADRASVLAQVFATRDRVSVIGKYSIDKDGDVTTSRYGRFVVRGGRLAYAGTALVKRDAFGNPLSG